MDGQVVEAGLDVVIGMGALVARLDRTVLAPWRAAIGDAAGIEGAPRGTVPHSVLLYGAPGSGVRFAASSLAAALDRLDRGSVIVAADRLDASPRELSALVEGAPRDVVLILASHEPWRLPLDAAGRRGRGSIGWVSAHGAAIATAFVHPPDRPARLFRAWELLAALGESTDWLDDIVDATRGWTGDDLRDALCGPLPWGDRDGVLAAIRAYRPSCVDWLTTARRWSATLPAGSLDDLQDYLRRYHAA
ncbi:MAG: hypothetical protein V9E99_02560 [Microthrixaceae bacterium]|jgi:hypothetical protein